MVKWLRQNSLYLLLIGCILTVGLAAWVLSTGPAPPEEKEVSPPLSSVEVAAPPIETEVAPVAVTMPTISEEASPAQVTAAEPAPKKVTYRSPCKGDILREYATDRLLYSETMGDWRTHEGVDFAAEVGTPVWAVADGEITEVAYDRLKGVTVSVRHSDGYTAVYSNLTELDAVVQGAKVDQGEVIGTVGETAMLELADPPHLHFELWNGDKHIDPFEKLPN